MAQYRYLAKTKDAKTIRDIEEASSQEELISKLRARGLFIVSVEKLIESKGAPGAFSLFTRKGKRSSIKLYDLVLLARNLSTTLSSGVTLLRSLEVLAYQTESAHLEEILKECSQYIKEGLSLSEAMAKYPNVFPSLWQGIVEVGEVSGNLSFVLERLADYLETRMEFERKIKSALIYPTILIIMGILAIIIFLKFILPKFLHLFEQFNVALPLPTRIVLGIGNFFETKFIFVILGIAMLISAFFSFRKRPGPKKFWDKASLKIPIFGRLIFISCLERLTSAFYILLDSGLPLVYTLEVVAGGIDNSFLAKNVLLAREKVRDGASLSDEFKKLNIFPIFISEMVKIGEETGSMPDIFKRISFYYQKELSVRIERFVLTIEPLMIIFMGILIGSIVISLFLPLFRLAGV